MKHSILIIALALLFCACKTQTPTIIEKEKYIYVTKDSVVNRDSTIYIPVEVYKDYSLDTLVLRTSQAISKSWLDTSSAYLVGEIRNLKAIQTKYIEVEKWHTKDSIVEKEVPVPYPVVEKVKYIPTWMKIITFLGGFVLLLFIGALWINKI